jgi:hypothetical protein
MTLVTDSLLRGNESGSFIRLQVTANVVPISPNLVTLMIEAIHSSEMLALIIASRRDLSEDGILHSHCREYLKSYIALTGWTL